MTIEQKLCEVKIFQIQYMSNAIKCTDQRFAFKNFRISCKNSGISCLALIFNLSYPRKTVLYAKIDGCRLRNTTSHIYIYFEQPIRTTGNGLVVKVIHSEFGDMGLYHDEC